GNPYQPTMAIPFNRLMDRLDLPSDSVIVDIGSGKGRVLLLSALRGFKKVVGIEFSSEFCKVARENVAIMENYLGKKLNITIIESDAAFYDIEDDQNIFFLFNPFDDVVLNTVAKNIIISLKRNDRKIGIIYYNPLHSVILDRFFLLKEKHIIAGEEYRLYVNELSAGTVRKIHRVNPSPEETGPASSSSLEVLCLLATWKK
ncbi:MAG: class I SAM-dependent methyltransferase, partial [Deltaproteobacteria bacterium]